MTSEDQEPVPPAPRGSGVGPSPFKSTEQLPSISTILPPLDVRPSRPHSSHPIGGASSASSGGSSRFLFGSGPYAEGTSSASSTPNFTFRRLSDELPLLVETGTARPSTSATRAGTPYMYPSPREIKGERMGYPVPSPTASYPLRDTYLPLPPTSSHGQHQQDPRATLYISSTERHTPSMSAAASGTFSRSSTSPYLSRLPDDSTRTRPYDEDPSSKYESKRPRLPGPETMGFPYSNEQRDRFPPTDPRPVDPRYSPYSLQGTPTSSPSYGQSPSKQSYRPGLGPDVADNVLENARRQREPSESEQRSGEDADQKGSGQRVLKRTYQACIRCRTKKLKCDSRLPRCTPCANAQFECQQADVRRQTSYPRGYVENLEHTCQLQEKILRRLIPDISPSRYKELLVEGSPRMEELERKLFGQNTSGPSRVTGKVEGLLLTGTIPYGSGVDRMG